MRAKRTDSASSLRNTYLLPSRGAQLSGGEEAKTLNLFISK